MIQKTDYGYQMTNRGLTPRIESPRPRHDDNGIGLLIGVAIIFAAMLGVIWILGELLRLFL